jgi:protein-L-isoaspartate O-methyltransferase
MLDDLLAAEGVARPLGADTLSELMTLAAQRRMLRPVLVELADEGYPVEHELAAVQRLRDLAATDAAAVVELLSSAGVSGAQVLALPVEDELLRLVRVRMPDGREALRAVEALEADGMRRWGPSSAGAWNAHLRTHHGVTLTCLDERPTRVELIWRSPPDTAGRWQRSVRKLLVPTQADFDTVALPGWSWPVYWLVRPARLLLSRLGWRRHRDPGDDLGPYLATPSGLTAAFVDEARLEAADLVVDLGCGDGRLLIDAVTRFGCRGRGVERDRGLVELARRNVGAAGLDARIDIVHADAATAPLDDATVVFVFLPAEVVASILRSLLARLRPGARVLAHEQVELRTDPPPGRSVLLIEDTGITVVHEWQA